MLSRTSRAAARARADAGDERARIVRGRRPGSSARRAAADDGVVRTADAGERAAPEQRRPEVDVWSSASPASSSRCPVTSISRHDRDRRARRSGSSRTCPRRRDTASASVARPALVGEHPGVLAAAALRRVDHQRAAAQRHARQPARGDLHVATEQHERPQVDVAALEVVVHPARVARERERRLRDVAARVRPGCAARNSSRSAAVACGPISMP